MLPAAAVLPCTFTVASAIGFFLRNDDWDGSSVWFLAASLRSDEGILRGMSLLTVEHFPKVQLKEECYAAGRLCSNSDQKMVIVPSCLSCRNSKNVGAACQHDYAPIIG